jgi:nitrogen regulatory protein PII
MAKLVMLITSRIGEIHTVGEGWKKAGAPGVTFIEGYGLRRLQEASKSGEILPGMLSLLEIMRDNEETSMVALTLIEDETIIDKLQAAAEAVLGSLYDPGSGIFFVINVERAVGLRDYASEK